MHNNVYLFIGSDTKSHFDHTFTYWIYILLSVLHGAAQNGGPTFRIRYHILVLVLDPDLYPFSRVYCIALTVSISSYAGLYTRFSMICI